MHQLLLDYTTSRGRVSYYHLANKSTTNDFLNVIHCINCMFELSLHLFMKKYIPALETLCLWRNNALFFKLSPWSLPVSHANTAHFSLQSIVLMCVVFSAHTLHPQALVLFLCLCVSLSIHLSLLPCSVTWHICPPSVKFRHLCRHTLAEPNVSLSRVLRH